MLSTSENGALIYYFKKKIILKIKKKLQSIVNILAFLIKFSCQSKESPLSKQSPFGPNPPF